MRGEPGSPGLGRSSAGGASRPATIATTRPHNASPHSTTSNVLVICWASPLPYTGFANAADRWSAASRGASPAPTTMRAMANPNSTAATDHNAAEGSDRLARLIRSQAATAAVTTSKDAIAALSYGEYGRSRPTATTRSLMRITAEPAHRMMMSSNVLRIAPSHVAGDASRTAATAKIAAAATHTR